MPYAIRKRSDDDYEIIKKETGESVGHSKTRREAERSIRARYRADNLSKEKRPKWLR